MLLLVALNPEAGRGNRKSVTPMFSIAPLLAIRQDSRGRKRPDWSAKKTTAQEKVDRRL